MNRAKFGNKKTNGFDSGREAKRAAELKLLEQLGEISNLQFQVKFDLIPQCGKQRPTRYFADFTYIQDGADVVEDCKGFRTAEYKLKKKLMLWVHGIDIKET